MCTFAIVSRFRTAHIPESKGTFRLTFKNCDAGAPSRLDEAPLCDLTSKASTGPHAIAPVYPGAAPSAA
jgi:hypothetical protein